jgi:micrococcal nuclease
VLTRTAIVASLGLAHGCADPACGPHESRVERVIDGDTIELANGDKVRYLLVDAPETTNGHADCFGANATRFNADLVLGKTVQLAFDLDCTDRYDRTLAYVTVDGTEVNSLMIERGYACVLHVPPDGDARAGELLGLQATAKAARRGLWGACPALPRACT